MAGKFNSKNRRLAKLRAKGSWFKGKADVDPPSVEDRKTGESSPRGWKGDRKTGTIVPEGRRRVVQERV